MNPRRLLFTVTTDLTYDQRMDRICTTLAEAGYQVRLIGRTRPTSVPLQQKVFRQTRLWGRFERGKAFYAEYNVHLFRHLRRSPADLICGIDLDTALVAQQAARFKKIPFVYDAHEYFTEMEEVVRRPAVQRAWRWAERRVLARTQYAYTVSGSIGERLTAQYGVPFEVIRNVPRRRPAVVPTDPFGGAPYLIYVGAVNEGRGLEQLLDALPRVPDLRLLVCGGGDVLDALRQRAAERQVAHRVRFMGFVTPADLPPLIAGAWAGYLLLSDQGLSYYYSLANKFFDYLHAGIPQLTVDFPEYRAINAQHEVACLLPLDVEQLVAALQKLQNEPTYYQRLADNARKAREVYHWEAEGQKLLAFYDRIFSS